MTGRVSGAIGIQLFRPFILASRRCAMNWKTLGWGTVVVALAITFVVFILRPHVEAQQGAAAQATTGAKYTIVDTEGTNLLVVDNSSNTLYFYTVEPGKEVGDDLHLRGSLDLNDVGKPVLKPKKAAK
jgi:hypothetical protein